MRKYDIYLSAFKILKKIEPRASKNTISSYTNSIFRFIVELKKNDLIKGDISGDILVSITDEGKNLLLKSYTPELQEKYNATIEKVLSTYVEDKKQIEKERIIFKLQEIDNALEQLKIDGISPTIGNDYQIGQTMNGLEFTFYTKSIFSYDDIVKIIKNVDPDLFARINIHSGNFIDELQ